MSFSIVGGQASRPSFRACWPRVLVLAGLSCGGAWPAGAEEAGEVEPTGSDQTQTELSGVVVTATRTNSRKDELATAASVFTRADIEQLQVKTLPDLLKGAIGVDMVQQGGYGQPSSVFMRGTNASHVLVLIDGVRAGSVTLGQSAFELIPMDQVERVEIIRGPQSSIYGSEAIGGVIQIFTRKAKQQEKPSIGVTAGAGSFDTQQEAVHASGRSGQSWYGVGASNLQSAGFDAMLKPYFGSRQRDGYRNTAVNARAGYQWDHVELEGFFTHAEGTNHYDAFTPGAESNKFFVNQVAGATAKWDVNQDWRTQLRLGQTQDDQQNYTPNGAPAGYFDTSRWNASWQNDLTLSDAQQFSLGSDFLMDQVFSDSTYAKNSRYDVGLFGELHSRWGKNQFTNASLRWDRNQAFGEIVTGSVGWRGNFERGLSLFANFGNAFKAPTFNDLYFRDGFGDYGNPHLKPEESKSVEAGLAGNHERVQWEARIYHTDIDNLIQWMPISPGNLSYTPSNIAKARIEGLETEIGWRCLGLRHKLNLNFLNPRDTVTHGVLPNRTQESATYDASANTGPWELGARLLAQAGRFNDDPNLTRLGGYVTLDLRSAYRFGKNWTLSAKLNNLLDKKYQTVANYQNFGRNFFITLQYDY